VALGGVVASVLATALVTAGILIARHRSHVGIPCVVGVLVALALLRVS
jgi:hypothetical protein